MVNLQDILQSAQGGKAAENLAQRFGISTEQAKAAMQALAPAVGIGLQRVLQSPGGAAGIIGQLSTAANQAAFQNAASAHSDAGMSSGSAILNQAFGDPNVTAQIAQQASRVTGLRPDLLAQMLPVIASMSAGGVMNALKSQGLSNALSQIGSGAASGAGSSPSPAGGLGGLVGSFMGILGALTGGKASGGSSSGQAALDALKGMLQPGPQVDPQHQAAIGDILKRA
ncbi:MAG: hypothetical protein QOC72_2582 [Methylobacteriaceae bacterium]|jgi:hypothetical protein|nr:hypothetical protein [Methylobacteriaceae bacterium]